jgi:hypothetical protein
MADFDLGSGFKKKAAVHCSWEPMILLSQGFARPTVTSAQVMLGRVQADGIFGPHTCAAVHEYQRKHQPRLTDDGVVGKHTWKALMAQNDVETVDVVDVDELVDGDPTSENRGHRIPHPESTYTGQALLGLKSGGSDPILLYGQSNGVATMVAQIMERVRGERKLVLLRIFGHGHSNSQKISGGKMPTDRDEDLKTLQTGNVDWWSPLLRSLQTYFVPWGSIELHGCDVAASPETVTCDAPGRADPTLVTMIANVTGVPVTAALKEQFGNRPGQWTFFGPTVTAFPYGADLKGWSNLAAEKGLTCR